VRRYWLKKILAVITVEPLSRMGLMNSIGYFTSYTALALVIDCKSKTILDIQQRFDFY